MSARSSAQYVDIPRFNHAEGLAGVEVSGLHHGGMFTEIKPSAHYFGSLVVLLTTQNPDGSTNITPMSSAWSLGEHYVLGLSSLHQGYANLVRTGEVVLNLPDAGMAEGIEKIAMTTAVEPVPPEKAGAYRPVRDKWSLAGWNQVPSMDVAPSGILQCPVRIEATLDSSWLLEDSLHALHVRVRRVQVRSDLALDASRVDIRSWEPVYYTFRHYFGQGRHLGENRRAEQRFSGVG